MPCLITIFPQDSGLTRAVHPCTQLQSHLPPRPAYRLQAHRDVVRQATSIWCPSSTLLRVAHFGSALYTAIMGLSYNIYLNSSRIYGCKNCKTHLSNHDDILSRVSAIPNLLSLPAKTLQNFRGQHGKAYLFDSVVNITESEPNERNMTTGRHVVRDIHCRQCKETVGWKYDKAYEASEKYKEGKFILEAELLCTVT